MSGVFLNCIFLFLVYLCVFMENFCEYKQCCYCELCVQIDVGCDCQVDIVFNWMIYQCQQYCDCFLCEMVQDLVGGNCNCDYLKVVSIFRDKWVFVDQGCEDLVKLVDDNYEGYDFSDQEWENDFVFLKSCDYFGYEFDWMIVQEVYDECSVGCDEKQ